MTTNPIDSEPVLEITDLHVGFGGNLVLRGMSLRVYGGFTGLIGPNGAGKTTCFNVISGLVTPSQGQVRLGQVDLLATAPAAIAKLGVGRTFQTPRLIPDMTVLENVVLGVDARRSDWLIEDLVPIGRARRMERDAVDRARRTLDRLGLGAVEAEEASAVPFASQKIVEIARALVAAPKLLLLDEPAAGLGFGDVAQLEERLGAIVQEDGIAVVVIEHDLELVLRLCPTISMLHFGTVLATGTPEQIVGNPAVVDAYLGAGFATD